MAEEYAATILIGSRRADLSRVATFGSATPVPCAPMARLVRAGALAWDEPLRASLPALSVTRSADVPLHVIAAHRAGLEAHRELFVPVAGHRQPRAEQILRPLRDLPNTKHGSGAAIAAPKHLSS